MKTAHKAFKKERRARRARRRADRENTDSEDTEPEEWFGGEMDNPQNPQLGSITPVVRREDNSL